MKTSSVLTVTDSNQSKPEREIVYVSTKPPDRNRDLKSLGSVELRTKNVSLDVCEDSPIIKVNIQQHIQFEKSKVCVEVGLQPSEILLLLVTIPPNEFENAFQKLRAIIDDSEEWEGHKNNIVTVTNALAALQSAALDSLARER